MQIDESDKQAADEDSFIRETLQPDSNVTRERFVQTTKLSRPNTSTDEGMHIDESDERNSRKTL
jgi:hypothetical protein